MARPLPALGPLAGLATKAQAIPDRQAVSGLGGWGGGGPLRIAVGARSTLFHLPVVLAQALGYFEAEGLQVHILDYAAGAHAAHALAVHAADLCCGAYQHVVRGQLQDQDWRSLVLLARAPQLALVADARLGSTADLARLKPLRVGVTAPGSSTDFLARLWLHEAGVPEAGLQFVALGSGAAAVQALREGQVHVISHADPVLTLLEQRASVRVLADTRSLKSSAQVYGGTMPGGCLFAGQSFIQRNPARCRRWSMPWCARCAGCRRRARQTWPGWCPRPICWVIAAPTWRPSRKCAKPSRPMV